MSTENIRRIQEQSMHISLEEINDAIIRLSKTINDARWSTQPRILLELAIVSIASGLDENAALIRHERRPAQAAAPSVNTAADTAHCAVPDSDSVENTRREKETAPPKPVMEQSAENEALWHAVFEEGEDGAGSFNLIRNGTVLAEVSEKTFTVIATSPFAKRYAQQKQQLIEGIMSRRLGRPMKMLCYSEGENIPGGSRIGAHVGPGGTAGADTEENMEDMARKASEILGMDITIE